MTTPSRRRPPNHRLAVVREIVVGSMIPTATIGLDPDGRLADTFLSGSEGGSDLAAIFDGAKALISIARQHNMPTTALHRNVVRHPESFDGPATAATSPIGPALGLLAGREVLL